MNEKIIQWIAVITVIIFGLIAFVLLYRSYKKWKKKRKELEELEKTRYIINKYLRHIAVKEKDKYISLIMMRLNTADRDYLYLTFNGLRMDLDVYIRGMVSEGFYGRYTFGKFTTEEMTKALEEFKEKYGELE